MVFFNKYSKNNKFDAKQLFLFVIPSLLIIFLPASLVSGPFLPDLIISYCAIISFWIIIKDKSNNSLKNFYLKFFLFFFIYINISSLLSEHIQYSLKTSIFYFRHGLFVLVFLYLIEINKNLLKKILYGLIFCYIFLAIDGIYQFNYGENFFKFKLAEDNRVSSLFGDELVLGAFFLRFYPILIGLTYYYLKNNKSRFSLFFFIFSSLTLIMIILSGERSAFILFLLTFIFILFMTKNLILAKNIIFLLLGISLLILFFSENRAKQRIFNFTYDQFVEKNIDGKSWFPTRHHYYHFKSGLQIFRDNIFFGSGPKTFRKVCSNKKYYINEFSCSTHPHNTYIQFLAELGLFGISFLLFILFLFIKYSFIHFYLKFFKKKFLFDNFQVIILSSFIPFLFPFMSSGNFFNNWLSIIYYFPIAIFIHSFNKVTIKN